MPQLRLCLGYLAQNPSSSGLNKVEVYFIFFHRRDHRPAGWGRAGVAGMVGQGPGSCLLSAQLFLRVKVPSQGHLCMPGGCFRSQAKTRRWLC